MMRDPYTETMKLESMPQESPSTVTLRSMPTELLNEICSAMHANSDIKSFRLVCRRFDAIASKHVLQIVHLDHFRESFDRLLAISSHPVFSRYVQSIYYIPSWFLTYHSLDEFRQACKLSYENKPGYRGITYEGYIQGLSDEAMITHYDEYKLQRRIQRLLLSSSKIYSILARACLQLPRLENFFVHRGISRHMDLVLRKTLVPPIISVGSPAGNPIPSLRAVGMAHIKLENLGFEWLRQEVFDKPVSCDLRIQSAFRSLHRFQAFVFLSRDPDNNWKRNFTDLLGLCPHLQRLKLMFAIPLRGTVVVRQNMILGSQGGWSELERLCLGGVTLNEEDLVKFVIARQPKMSRIRLIECPFKYGGSCESVYRRLKPYCFLSFHGYDGRDTTGSYVFQSDTTPHPAFDALSNGMLEWSYAE